MRKTLTISLPQELLERLEREVKIRHCASTSEFIRGLINKWFAEQEERKLLLKTRSNQLLKQAIERATTDLD